MNKGIIIGIIIVIIIGVVVVSSGNSLEETSEVSLEEETSEVSLEEEMENEPKQFNVGLSETIGFKEG